ncbi:LAFA_0E17172g1_1 [Lachancea sp. 'fantastica']|nr:LAFA_0E17172g1_1 [Lachancea sp. 'fantastica']
MRAFNPRLFFSNSIYKSYSTSANIDVSFSTASLKIGWASQVRNHPNSDKMYISKIQLSPDIDVDGGEPVFKQVCSGLRPYITADELQGQLLLVIDNMKKCKLRGEISEAMVLCGDGDVDNGKVVRTCVPSVFDRRLIGKQVFLKDTVQTEPPTRKIKPNEWLELSNRLSVGTTGEVVYKDPKTGQTTPLCVSNGEKTVSIMVHSVPAGTPIR